TPTVPPLPKLELVFQGALTSPRTGSVKAIVNNKRTKKTDYYRLHDIIPDTDGAKIVTITRTSITLDRQGQLETIELYPSDQNPLLKGGDGKRLSTP
ncbi:MAG: hypothetical protein NT045_01520, partial [Candidatus Aureabacteria bacterium]|nr:hypothetical protein [Candidatus Auribacterota bacterium]